MSFPRAFALLCCLTSLLFDYTVFAPADHLCTMKENLDWENCSTFNQSVLVLNLVIGLVPWWMGLQSLAVLALLPVVAVPLVGALAYWITWQDFHR